MAVLISTVLLTLLYVLVCLRPAIIPFYTDETKKDIVVDIVIRTIVMSLFMGPTLMRLWYRIITGLWL